MTAPNLPYIYYCDGDVARGPAIFWIRLTFCFCYSSKIFLFIFKVIPCQGADLLCFALLGHHFYDGVRPDGKLFHLWTDWVSFRYAFKYRLGKREELCFALLKWCAIWLNDLFLFSWNHGLSVCLSGNCRSQENLCFTTDKLALNGQLCEVSL